MDWKIHLLESQNLIKMFFFFFKFSVLGDDNKVPSLGSAALVYFQIVSITYERSAHGEKRRPSWQTTG